MGELAHGFELLRQEGIALEVGIDFYDGARRSASFFDEVNIGQRGHREIGQAGLLDAEKFSGAADAHVLFGKQKSVVSFCHCLQTAIADGVIA